MNFIYQIQKKYPQISFKNLLAIILLFFTITTPTLLMSFGSDSMAPGLSLVFLLYIFLFRKNKNTLNYIPRIFIFALIIIIFFHGLVNFFIHENFNFSRFYQSLIFFFFFLLSAILFAISIDQKNNRRSDFIFKCVFFLFSFMAMYRVFGFSPLFKSFKESAIFLYLEPSHFALDYLPFLFYFLIQTDFKGKIILFVISLMFGFLIPNLTLILGIILILLLLSFVKDILLSLLLLLFFSLFILFFYNYAPLIYPNNYFYDRIFFNGINLSSLTFLSGFERAYLNFVDFFGFGVGFQQLGIIGQDGYNMGMIVKLLNYRLCALDGSTVAAKLIGEFGIFGIFLISYYFFYFFKFIERLRSIQLNPGKLKNSKEIFFISIFLVYFVDLFIRGTAYFSSSSFLFVAALIWLFKFNANTKK